jgi:hypothetical protein
MSLKSLICLQKDLIFGFDKFNLTKESKLVLNFLKQQLKNELGQQRLNLILLISKLPLLALLPILNPNHFENFPLLLF